MNTQYREFDGPAIAMGELSKMLDDDAILQIRGACDCDGGKLDDENRG